jgi:hypothetical protein
MLFSIYSDLKPLDNSRGSVSSRAGLGQHAPTQVLNVCLFLYKRGAIGFIVTNNTILGIII